MLRQEFAIAAKLFDGLDVFTGQLTDYISVSAVSSVQQRTTDENRHKFGKRTRMSAQASFDPDELIVPEIA